MKSARCTTRDEKITQSLLNNCQYFVNTLGEPAREGESLVFPQANHHFASFRVRYVEESKFLGKIYAMVVEAKVAPRKRSYGDQKAELFYPGYVVRQRPFFKAVEKQKNGQQSSAALVEALNRNSRLLDACRNLDLEYLRVFYDQQEEVWRIQVRPYGGSLVHIMLPPMRYNVILPKGHAEEIMVVIKHIAALLKEEV